MRELINNNTSGQASPVITACQNPVDGHKITKEYRTKMIDWMIEVCTSFKCAPKTYFIAVTIFDKYMIACKQAGRILENTDIHLMGVTSIYLASKYEDVFPLHSKVVSEKIAHGAITPSQILDKERDFLNMFNFEMDFVTYWDFHETYTDKIEKQLFHNI